MRGNSKYLRWAPLYTCCCVLVIISSTVIGVPVRPRRMVRETYPNLGVNYTSTQKTELCLKDGNEVDKSTVQCDIKNGCRLIQRTGECCPEYQCDCTRDEKTYKNGEKITDPDSPCRVCVCKGGEITCYDKSCYTRNDCEPRNVPGQCCPAYDNCPILENVQLAPSKESNSKEIFKKSTVKPSTSTSPVSSTTETQTILNAENPLGIKIKEITKAEEIRITDDKPKPFKPSKSVITSKELLNPSTPSSLPLPVPTPSTPIDEIKSISEDTNQTLESMQNDEPVEQTSEKQIDSGEILHLGIADVNALGDGSSNKSVRQANKNASETEQSSDDNANVTKSAESKETENSEVTSTPIPAVEETSSPVSTSDPSVVRVGNDVVIVKDSVNITLRGAAGLQQGEDSENDESRKHENDVGATTEQVLESSSDKTILAENESKESSSEGIPDLGPQDAGTTESETILGDAASSGELVSMGSDESNEGSRRKFSVGKSSKSNKNNDSGSYEVVDSNESATEHKTDKPSDSSEEIFEPAYYETTKGPLNTIAYEPRYFGSSAESSIEGSSSPFDDDLFSSTGEAHYSTAGIGSSEITSTSSPSIESSSRYLIEEEEIIPNENPEFPDLPEDLTLHYTLNEEEAKKRIPSKIVIETTIGPIDETKAPASSIRSDQEKVRSDSLRSSELISSTAGPDASALDTEELSAKKTHKLDKIQERSPGEPLLIPEWERTTTESDEGLSTNSDDNINSSQPQNNSTLKTDDTNAKEAENYKLSNELSTNEQNEATTVQPPTKKSANLEGELDSTVSSTDHYDPDEDSESIKYHDSNEDNTFHFFETPSFFNPIGDYLRLQQKNWNS